MPFPAARLRSGALAHRLQDRHALHVVDHRRQVEHPLRRGDLRQPCAPGRALTTFRLPSEEAQFAKYSIVEVDVRIRRGDRRLAGRRPNLDTLRALDRIPPSYGWRQRYAHMEPLVAPRLCGIKWDRGTQEDHFPCERAAVPNREHRQATAAHLLQPRRH